jgi:hypothetical protein
MDKKASISPIPPEARFRAYINKTNIVIDELRRQVQSVSGIQGIQGPAGSGTGPSGLSGNFDGGNPETLPGESLIIDLGEI